MSACEKCWNDAFRMSCGNKSQPECYVELLTKRKDNPCTPEQQAGVDATICEKCRRKTKHQYTGECMNCK